MKVSKMLVSLLFGIGIVSVSSSSFVSASPVIEIGNGQRCGKLNLIRDDGVFSYRCVKQCKICDVVVAVKRRTSHVLA